jgi:glycosyltransferase involved in cell wall biosynthesis
MKKILYIEANRDGTIGGSYYSLLYLVQGLNKAKYEPHIMFCQENALIPEFKKVTPYVYVNDFDPSISAPANSFRDVIKWPYRFLLELILKQFDLKKIINQIRPDLVHLNNGYAAMHEWVLAGYLNKIKVVSHDRGTRAPCSLRTKFIVRFVDAIISVSDSYKRNVTNQKLKVRRTVRVYNGLDPHLLEARGDALGHSRNLRKEFNIHPGDPIVGIVGNVDGWKGQLVVAQAIEKVRHLYPNIKCLIVGKTPVGAETYEREIREYILKNHLEENILLLGFRRDISQILNVLDILIHASIEPEPFGRVILEGMAAKKPIVATNSGGTPEQIVDGETGLLVPMGDADKMAEALHYFLSDMKRANEMGEKGRKRLISLFSVKNMVDEIEKIYEDIFNS